MKTRSEEYEEGLKNFPVMITEITNLGETAESEREGFGPFKQRLVFSAALSIKVDFWIVTNYNLNSKSYLGRTVGQSVNCLGNKEG